MKASLFALFCLVTPTAFAATNPGQAEDLARDCRSHKFVLSAPNDVTLESRLRVISLLRESTIFETTRADDPRRRFMMMTFQIKLQPGLNVRRIAASLREILSVENIILDCENTFDLPQTF